MGFTHTKPGLTSVLAPGRRFPLDALQEGLHILVGGRAGYVVASCILTLARDNSSYVAVRSAADR